MLKITILLLTAASLLSQQWDLAGMINEKITSIEFVHSQDSVFYVGSYSNFSEGTTGKVFYTSNGGATFDTLLTGVSVLDIEVHPLNSDLIFCSTSAANATMAGVFKSTDSGTTWFRADSGIDLDWETAVVDIALDPYSIDILYAGTAGFFGGAAFRSVNGGASWENIGDASSGEIYDSDITALTAHPTTPGKVLLGTYGVGMIYESENHGSDWQLLIDLESYGGGGIEEIIYDHHNPQNMFAAFYFYGILKSTDYGSTWQLMNEGLTEDRVTCIRIHPEIENQIIAGAYEAGVFQSVDNGDSWVNISEGLQNTWITAVTYNPSGTQMYCGTYDGLYSRPSSPNSIDLNEHDTHHYEFEMECFPNPFNETFTIRFNASSLSSATVSILSLTGSEIMQKTIHPAGAQTYELFFNPDDVNRVSFPSGVYIVKISSGSMTTVKKVSLVK